MRILSLFLITSVFIFSCNNNTEKPNVSKINIELSTQRFENDFFSLDTNNLYNSVEQLQAKYPGFGENYFTRILNADPRWSADTMQLYVGSFITAYRKLYMDSKTIFTDFSPFEKEIKTGLKFVKYYFPKYPIPNKIITYIGPVDGYGDALADDAILVGLHHHLGKDYPIYKTEMVQQFYPEYISNRFEPDYIVVNCMKNIVNDLYPEKEDDRVLIYQMIEKGKRYYLLSKLLPDVAEYKLMGYSKEQMDACYKNEARIWDLFTKNGYLQMADKNTIRNYVEESPKTQELGSDAPGNIGSFTGWQIVKKYMSKNEKISPSELMLIDNEKIVQETKYKP
jgi:hypothetical protein